MRIPVFLLLSIPIMAAKITLAEPIVILEYRGQGFQGDGATSSNSIFIMDPEHSEKHVVQKGQSLGQIINQFYAESGLDKRFLKLAIVAANPKAFAQENPNFMFAGAKLHLPSLNQIQAMILGVPYEKSPNRGVQGTDRGIFFFGG
jgi:hypothetical protein